MAYDLHIERTDQKPIALSEWRAAVGSTKGVRLLSAAAHTVTNPKPGEVISMGASDGDAEVLFSNESEWRFVFRWNGVSALFAARFNTADTSHPVWQAAVALASRLNAVIRGDGGETYDFETGRTTGTCPDYP